MGNQAFGSRKYDEAIYYYNLAIENFPSNEEDELAKTYQNRAAAYDALVYIYININKYGKYFWLFIKFKLNIYGKLFILIGKLQCG